MNHLGDLKTIGELKDAGYTTQPIKTELRNNLINHLRSGNKSFSSIIGYENTVIPDLERAILSQHNILLLGLRGQAKTKIAHTLIDLLDDKIPIVKGSEINDDPFRPLSRYAIDMIEKHGDKTPIEWIKSSQRIVEKLATPDVSVADLIGDIDPIKAATLKLPYSDQRVIHFGLIPRANRSIFIINELPDLQARIQVSLFSILQEKYLQIRGFNLSFPLDIMFVFTANPEDYTNRGSIVTPLKDRIESQILTHYPLNIEYARAITSQESKIEEELQKNVYIPDDALDLIEMINFEARESEYIDTQSGVSARIGISALENLMSCAERRMILNSEKKTSIRLSDFLGILPSIIGKVELIYEGEQRGIENVILDIMDIAIAKKFLQYFPHPEEDNIKNKDDIYEIVKTYFAADNQIDLGIDIPDKEYAKKLNNVAGLSNLVKNHSKNGKDKYFIMEILLHGLAHYDVLDKVLMDSHIKFSDPLSDMLKDL